jgi:hypothetical protein
MPQNPTMTGDAYWSCRFAPYCLVVAAVALGLSMIWVTPRIGYLGLAAVSGTAVVICHAVKWYTGHERYQLLAMAFGVVPLLIALPALNSGQKAQYACAVLIAYATGLILLTRRIYGWISMNTDPGASPNGGPATQPGNSGVTEGPPSVS